MYRDQPAPFCIVQQPRQHARQTRRRERLIVGIGLALAGLHLARLAVAGDDHAGDQVGQRRPPARRRHAPASARSRRRSPLPVAVPQARLAVGDRAQQVAVEAVVGAVLREIVLDVARRAGRSVRAACGSIASRAPSAPSPRRAARSASDRRPRPSSPSRRLTAPGRRRSAPRRRRASASASRSASVRRASSCSARPSSGRKPGAIPASAGKAASSVWAKAWMVWMRRPPGASSTRANRRRARCSVGGIVALAEREQIRCATRRPAAAPRPPAARRCGWPSPPRRPW